ncbi:trypco2 family protein [Streptomyces cyaneus]|uniref:trypco2 family protein n=1 Tax=Streptomyces cyaneus TaxID=1904 RepID=UPI000FF8A64C|nr:trypco2 family protein [Streptomyces cyaneus]
MNIELADAVAGLRDELLAAAARGAGQEVVFDVGTIELELAVELRTDAKAKAGFKAWVVSGDAEAGVSRGRTHRVTLSLTPRRADGGDLLVGGDSRRPAGPGDVSDHIGR